VLLNLEAYRTLSHSSLILLTGWLFSIDCGVHIDSIY